MHTKYENKGLGVYMGLVKGIGRAFQIFRSSSKRKMVETAKSIKRQYGFKGLCLAVLNKINGRPLLYYLKPNYMQGEAYTNNGVPFDEIGEMIFQKQQMELSKEEMQRQIDGMGYKPLISIIMPIYNAPPKWLQKALESIRNQYYSNWELCAVDDGSKDRRGIAVLEKFQTLDNRIHLYEMEKNSGISAASNLSLKMCQGDYCALMDQDDEITPDALFWFVKAINQNREAEFLYSDECKVNTKYNGDRFDFFFKPDWSPSMLVNYMYIGHLTIYKTDTIRKIGGFRTLFDFSQDYDLALRVSDITDKIIHIERVLYYWRALPSSGAGGGKDYARISNLATLQDWYHRQNLSAIMECHDQANYGRIVLEKQPKVSIIIPTDSYKNLKQCLDGITQNMSYANIEVIPVTNSALAEKIEKEYRYLEALKICEYNKIYNFSDKCNEGAECATGEYLVFYNDDVIPFTKDWLEKLIEILQYPGVGGVSPLLLYEDQTIQYAGMITGTPGLIGTSFNGRHYLNLVKNPYTHLLLRDVSILSGACMAMKKSLFFEVGGFDALNTPAGHSDLDLSLRIAERNLRCVYTPYSILTHVGNHSWEEKNSVDKADIFCLKRWGKYLECDRYFTDSMKKMFYNDFNFTYKIYSPKNLVVPARDDSRDILFLSHELTRTGAPVVLMNMVKIVLENGDFPVVLCPVDGPLRQEFLKMGVTVIIDESFTLGHWTFEHFARNFDIVIANTLACANAVKLLEKSIPPVLWWIHEGTFAYRYFKNILPNKLGEKVKIYPVSEYVQNILEEKHLKCQGNLLPWGIADLEVNIKTQLSNQNAYLFLMIGSIEKRKGQDILLDAINLLPNQYKKKAQFAFVGNTLEKDLLKKILDEIAINPNIKFYGSIPHNEVYRLYQQSICAVVPSRDEPLSVVAAEAMMFSKPCICSDHTGIAFFIKDGEDGLIFKSENSKELAEKIVYIMDHLEKAKEIGEAGRKLYDENFTIEKFKLRVNQAIDEMLNVR